MIGGWWMGKQGGRSIQRKEEFSCCKEKREE
jgi:hypothetical protein